MWFTEINVVHINCSLKIEEFAFGQSRVFRARMTSSQSLAMTYGALKVDYASVIFVDPEIPIDELKLDSLITVADWSLVVHMLARQQQTSHVILYSIDISQGSASTRLRCGENINRFSH